MAEFFRYPQTPHLEWFGEGSPRGDKVLSPEIRSALLSSELVLEEKIDGANLGISIADNGELQFQNRGQYLTKPYAGQFVRLESWCDLHGEDLRAILDPTWILFGEWCAAKHSLAYEFLSDYFLCFDVYDRAKDLFWSSSRRNEIAKLIGLEVVPTIGKGVFDLKQLMEILNSACSAFSRGPIEGIYIRQEDKLFSLNRAKLVRAEFIQDIGEHWSRRNIEWNRIKW